MSAKQTHAEHLSHELIPVIDISALRDGSDCQGVADALLSASQDVGFIYICGHGIQRQIIDDLRHSALDFFRQPQLHKEQLRVRQNHRGWLGQGAAKMHDDALPDLKESFIWGYQDALGEAGPAHPLRGTNRWPSSQTTMQAHCMAWYQQASAVAQTLLRGFALALGGQQDLFIGPDQPGLSRASCVYYPPQVNAQEHDSTTQFGVAPHTDFGVLTILAQDDIGGLQVQHKNGHWYHAPPLADTLVVNVGDLLARWTNDTCRSTPHRVINSSGKERLSLVLAHDPAPTTMIDPRDVFGTNCATHYAAISCEDYLNWRFAKAFAYRQQT